MKKIFDVASLLNQENRVWKIEDCDDIILISKGDVSISYERYIYDFLIKCKVLVKDINEEKEHMVYNISVIDDDAKDFISFWTKAESYIENLEEESFKNKTLEILDKI